MSKLNYVSVSRDPFARQDVVRARMHLAAGRTCDWCGRPGRPCKTGGVRLFMYGIETDDRPGRAVFASGYYCSVGCFRSMLE